MGVPIYASNSFLGHTPCTYGECSYYYMYVFTRCLFPHFTSSQGPLQGLSAICWSRRKFSCHIQVGVSKFDLNFGAH